MTEKYVYIESYAHAESLGIKPIDSIINAVIDVKACQKGNYLIVGCSQGHTFIHKEPFRDIANKTFIAEFQDNEIEIYAKNLTIAKIILSHDYNPGTKIILWLKHYTLIEDIEV
jgi:putative aminopeptidase FrvX